MSTDSGQADNPWQLDQVLDEKQLELRPARAPNLELENSILHQLTREAASRSEHLLQTIADTVSGLYADSSVCIGIKSSENQKIRWVAMASSGQHHLINGKTGDILFPQDLQICQVLPVPFFRDGIEVGTLWVLAHTPATQFDREDLRLLSSVATFAAVGLAFAEISATTSPHESPYADHNSYIAKLSHDMRSPLGAIIGFSDLLKEDDLTSEQRSKFGAVIARNANDLLQMIDGVLNSVKNEVPKSSQHSAKGKLAGIKVLVVDDLDDNRGLLEILLRSVGASVDCAADGESGVAKAVANNYDVIIMDIQMPGMDGYQTLEKLREKNCYTPAVALTANASFGQRERAIAKGFHGFLNKPIERESFIHMVASLANAEKRTAGASAKVITRDVSGEISSPAKMTCSILVVEDDSDVRELIEYVGLEAGAQIRLAGTGQEALRILETDFIPNLIFLDLTLPDLGGDEIFGLIRQNPRWYKSKVILLSGHDNLAARAHQIGADGSLMKPFDVDQIEYLISSHQSIASTNTDEF